MSDGPPTVANIGKTLSNMVCSDFTDDNKLQTVTSSVSMMHFQRIESVQSITSRDEGDWVSFLFYLIQINRNQVFVLFRLFAYSQMRK